MIVDSRSLGVLYRYRYDTGTGTSTGIVRICTVKNLLQFRLAAPARQRAADSRFGACSAITPILNLFWYLYCTLDIRHISPHLSTRQKAYLGSRHHAGRIHYFDILI